MLSLFLREGNRTLLQVTLVLTRSKSPQNPDIQSTTGLLQRSHIQQPGGNLQIFSSKEISLQETRVRPNSKLKSGASRHSVVRNLERVHQPRERDQRSHLLGLRARDLQASAPVLHLREQSDAQHERVHSLGLVPQRTQIHVLPLLTD